jgi:hypothetical protein
MKKNIVITSIFPPTIAVNAFSELKNYKTIVIGDKKSPELYTNSNVDFFSINDQLKLGYSITGQLPFNHYSRKNIGYINAIKNKAELIIDTDDDNIPYDDWSFPEFCNNYELTEKDKGFINIYELFCDKKIWPRGYPLNLINRRDTLNQNTRFETKGCKVGVWQGLADDDPDVDALYRLTNDEACFFDKRNPVVLDTGTICPFNSQNTAFTKAMFPLLYMPSLVEFRYTDILRGLIAQPIMWLYDYKLGFTKPTVIQKRNPHNYMKDFQSEIPMYLTGPKIHELISNKINPKFSIGDNLFIAYEVLVGEKIAEKKELDIVKCWLDDIA